MALKKMRAKTHKGTQKRIKITNGGDLKKGLMLANRPGDNHRNIKKTRERLLRARRASNISKAHASLKKKMY
jgi:ribosomal protein L35